MNKTTINQLWRIPLFVTLIAAAVYTIVFLCLGYIPKENHLRLYWGNEDAIFGLPEIINFSSSISRVWDIPIICIISILAVLLSKRLDSNNRYISKAFIYTFTLAVLNVLLSIITYDLLRFFLISGFFTAFVGLINALLNDDEDPPLNIKMHHRLIYGLIIGIASGLSISVIIGLSNIGLIHGFIFGAKLSPIFIGLSLSGAIIGIILRLLFGKEMRNWLSGQSK